MTTPTTNSKESLQQALETARQRKEVLEQNQAQLIDSYLHDKNRWRATAAEERFTRENIRLRDQIQALEKEIVRCRESLDALPFS